MPKTIQFDPAKVESKPARKTLGGKGHKPDCPCRVCSVIHNAIATGQTARKQRLTKRETVFAESAAAQFAATGKVNATAAALTAGCDPEVAGKQGPQWLAKNSVQSHMVAALRRAGITLDTLAQKIAEGLDASETKVTTTRNADGSTQAVVTKVKDFHAIHKYAETQARMEGVYPKDEPVSQVPVINIWIPRVMTPGHDIVCRCEACQVERQKIMDNAKRLSGIVPPEYKDLEEK